jgi:DMSO/TMAO reductase YedYZ molybdopterin-dependent catalytic subunit
MNTPRPPRVLTGALVGGLLTAALLAIFYAASQLVGTPFVPFDLFDWMGRILPGAVVRFGIDLIVSTISAFNLGETSSTAKIAEHIIAIGQIIVFGVVVGTVLFALLRRRTGRAPLLIGLALGAVVGIVVAIISDMLNQTATTPPVVNDLWIIILFLLWGAALVWAYNNLAVRTAAVSPDMPEATAYPLNRREFLVQFGGATAAITVVGAGVGALLNRSTETVAASVPAAEATAEAGPVAWSQTHALPNAAAALAPAPGTRPELTPLDKHYRIDINSLPPVLHEEDWTLDISGMVENPMQLTLADIRNNYEPISQFVTLSCISNPVGGDLISTQRWTGVPLKQIIEQVKPTINGGYLHIKAADGFDETVVLNDVLNDERIMLTYEWDGLPLTTSHGFPLRIYIPNLYGMKQPKWITSIEVTDQVQDGYWVRRGWDEVAKVQTTSVVDTVATDSVQKVGDKTLVPVGGIAYAGARGISKVEVKVDDGDWQEAQLRAPMSETTWVIWRYDWPFEAGEHRFYVRAVDGNGTPQIDRSQDVYPSGATGYDSLGANL